VTSMRNFLSPTSIAVVGASDNSEWSVNLSKNLIEHSPGVKPYFVNPGRDVVHGHRSYSKLSAIDGTVDLAFIMVRQERVAAALRDAGSCGIRSAIVLSSGFGEVAGGVMAEKEIRTIAAQYSMHVLGPNASGFINASGGVVAYSMSLSGPPLVGTAGFVLHSGGLVNPLMAAAEAWGIGYSTVVSTGNEAVIDAATVIDLLVEDEATRAIGVFLESFRDPERFRQAARRALAAGKPIVALVVGASEAAQRAALAHTGALTPDALVTASALRHLGIQQVSSLEELIVTTGLLATPNRLRFGPRVGVVSASGGACDIISDTAERLDISLADFEPHTRSALREIMPSVAVAQNPLDLTGFVASAADLPNLALEIVANAPEVDVVLFQAFAQPSTTDPDPEAAVGWFRETVASLNSFAKPCLLIDAAAGPLSPLARIALADSGALILPGIHFGMSAVRAAISYDQVRERALQRDVSEALPLREGSKMWGEAASLEWLTQHGVPCVEFRLARDEQQAAECADKLGGLVAIKVSSEEIPHKSDIGGVELDVQGRMAAAEAFRRVLDSVQKQQPDAILDGVIVTPMQSAGVEFIVGVRRDNTWGQLLMVGLGGVFVEVLKDVSIRILPVSREDIEEMLDELRGAPLLRGARGSAAIDRGALVDAVVAVADLAVNNSETLDWLEINPLLAGSNSTQALDALVCAVPSQAHSIVEVAR
jgi:acyl-CoA synthetase (NDP forming)